MDSEKDIWSPLFLLLVDLVIWWLLGDVLTNETEPFLNIICFSAALVLLVVVIIELLELLQTRRAGRNG